MLRRLDKMRVRSIVYPIMLSYEILRLYLLLQQNLMKGSSNLPLSWYAGVGLLCLVPILILMVYLDENEFSLWLPLISLIKALGLPSCILFIFRTAPDALQFGSSGDFILIKMILSALFLIAGDTCVGLYCFRRSRKLCK